MTFTQWRASSPIPSDRQYVTILARKGHPVPHLEGPVKHDRHTGHEGGDEILDPGNVVARSLGDFRSLVEASRE
jgi:hypothetical protein